MSYKMDNQDICKSYAGFTIGPIYDVMRHSKKTRELWFGSYFFSWYMEKLTAKIKENNKDTVGFLTPFIAASYKPNASLGGKFYDRFVLGSSLEKKELYEIIETANNDIFKYFSKLIDELAKNESKKKDHKRVGSNTIDEILKGYLQTRFFSIDADKIDTEIEQSVADNKKKTIVGIVDEYLNSMEEGFIFKPGKSTQTCQRCKTLPGIIEVKEKEKEKDKDGYRNVKIIVCPLCFVKLRAHQIVELNKRLEGKNKDRFVNGKISYPSIPEISAKEIFEKDEVKAELKKCNKRADEIDFDELSKILKELKKLNEIIPKKENKITLKSMHKYFAVVQADGDNLGKLAAGSDKSGGNGGIEPSDLSKRLFDFAEESEELIYFYGGVPVYLGGDDILAFMPVYYQGGTILDFLKEIADAYHRVVDKEVKATTISFGVNISYNKFPLSTARGKAEYLLFNEAKKEKNSIAICLTKHSGAETKFTVKIDDPIFNLLNKLVKKIIDNTIKLPKGIHYNLGRFRNLIARIPDKNRLEAFFKNNFDEGVHKKKFKNGISEVEELFAHYLFPSAEKKGGIDAVNAALNILKFIRFLTGEEEL